jgi:hypothetical protein
LPSLFFSFPYIYFSEFFVILGCTFVSLELLSSYYFVAIKPFLLLFSSSSSAFLKSLGLSNSDAVSNSNGLKFLSLAFFRFSEVSLCAILLESPALSVNLLFFSSSSFS